MDPSGGRPAVIWGSRGNPVATTSLFPAPGFRENFSTNAEIADVLWTGFDLPSVPSPAWPVVANIMAENTTIDSAS